MRRAVILLCISFVVPSSLAATPINDLGTGLYLNQFQGGLYPGGLNDPPPAHRLAGDGRAAQVGPLDLQGQPDPAGKFVFLSIGMSNTSQEFAGSNHPTNAAPWSFMGQAAAHPAVDHSSMVLFNGARGGQSAATWDQPTDQNYARVASELATAGLSESQVRVAWLKLANPQPTTSLPAANADSFTLVQQMGDALRAMKQHYPNLDMVFVSSRIYAGYATTPLNPEPYAYESAFALKRLVEAQITQAAGGAIDPLAGDMDFDGAGTVVPWIAWGPYLWADGLNPRNDGLTWAVNEFQSDGTHPSQIGQEKVGRLLMQHMIRSPFSRDWFLSTLPGDANLDHVVDLNDFNILAINFGQSGKTWLTADFTYDGLVNLADFNALASNFGLGAGANGVVDPDDWAALASAVPEPSSLLAAALASTATVLPRCRRNIRSTPGSVT